MPTLVKDEQIRDVLSHSRVIAVVGHSDRPSRPSYQIAQFLRQVGYSVYPVNPAIAFIEDQPSYPTLQAVPEPIDIVNVFRRSEHLIDVVQEAIATWGTISENSSTRTIWAQQGISNPIAEQIALDAGVNIIMNACIKIEYRRLGLQAQ